MSELFKYCKAKDFPPEGEVLSRDYAELLMKENAYLKKKLKRQLMALSRILSLYQTKTLDHLTEIEQMEP